MRRIQSIISIMISTLLIISVITCNSIESDNPSPHIGEGPAFRHHLNQADIENRTLTLKDLLSTGELLMKASFNTLDGAGRPSSTGTGDSRESRDSPENFNRISGPDANSCAGCHNMPGVGGGGDNVANVFVLGQRLPFIDFDGGQGDDFEEHTLSTVANERNTLGMFGSGYIELLAREMTSDLLDIRTQALQESKITGTQVTKTLITKSVFFGKIIAHPNGSIDTSMIEGVDTDLIIKPFHQKGAVISLRQFTNNAMNHHHGIQSAERFGLDLDPDSDGIVNELTVGDITAITVFQATLPVPGRVFSKDPKTSAAIKKGDRLFSDLGCITCHIPELPLYDPIFTEPNPFNPPGNLRVQDVTHSFSVDLTKEGPQPLLRRNSDGVVMVPAFTDLKRHDMGEMLNNEKLKQGNIPTEEWLTRKLWGFVSEPPYMHHGRATLISEAILMHGGAAKPYRDAFTSMSLEDQSALIEFLETFQVLPDSASELTIFAESN